MAQNEPEIAALFKPGAMGESGRVDLQGWEAEFEMTSPYCKSRNCQRMV